VRAAAEPSGAPSGSACGARGGTAAADAASFTLSATAGGAQYAIGENRYLAEHASTLSYTVTITLGEGTWAYDERTMLRMQEFPEPFAHTDHNTLRKVGDA